LIFARIFSSIHNVTRAERDWRNCSSRRRGVTTTHWNVVLEAQGQSPAHMKRSKNFVGRIGDPFIASLGDKASGQSGQKIGEKFRSKFPSPATTVGFGGPHIKATTPRRIAETANAPCEVLLATTSTNVPSSRFTRVRRCAHNCEHYKNIRLKSLDVFVHILAIWILLSSLLLLLLRLGISHLHTYENSSLV